MRIAVIGVVCLHFITNVFSREESMASTSFATNEELATELHLANLPQLVQADERVTAYLEQFTRYGRPETEAILGRAIVYFPIFSAALQEKGLPETFKFLPIVESNLRADVESSRGAAGIWQFMPATARYYGLEVNERLDQRKDVRAATEAAATMLAELMDRFGDWKLALAAYNCGPARVKRAIRKADSQSFKHIRPYLPRQTRNYIDKFIAVCYLGQAFQSYGLTPKVDPQLALQFRAAVKVEGRVRLATLAEAINISSEILLQLNPQLPAADIPLQLSGELQVPLFAHQSAQDFVSLEAVSPKEDSLHKTLRLEGQKMTQGMTRQLAHQLKIWPQKVVKADTWAVIRRTWLTRPDQPELQTC